MDTLSLNISKEEMNNLERLIKEMDKVEAERNKTSKISTYKMDRFSRRVQDKETLHEYLRKTYMSEPNNTKFGERLKYLLDTCDREYFKLLSLLIVYHSGGGKNKLQLQFLREDAEMEYETLVRKFEQKNIYRPLMDK